MSERFIQRCGASTVQSDSKHRVGGCGDLKKKE
jgi:hypothetical protein